MIKAWIQEGCRSAFSYFYWDIGQYMLDKTLKRLSQKQFVFVYWCVGFQEVFSSVELLLPRNAQLHSPITTNPEFLFHFITPTNSCKFYLIFIWLVLQNLFLDIFSLLWNVLRSLFFWKIEKKYEKAVGVMEDVGESKRNGKWRSSRTERLN